MAAQVNRRRSMSKSDWKYRVFSATICSSFSSLRPEAAARAGISSSLKPPISTALILTRANPADSAAFRPARELKGFKKVFLKAGESASVTIPFDGYTFRVFNPKANEWQRESGTYGVLVGASSDDIRLSGEIAVQGNATDFGYDRAALADYFTGKVADVDAKQFETLLGRELPDPNYKFYKKNRMVIHENCTVDDLRYSRRWVGRFFSWAIRFARSFMWAIGNKTMANTLTMGMVHQPVRGLAKFTGMSRRQMEALLLMFNGHFFKGAGRFITKEKADKN